MSDSLPKSFMKFSLSPRLYSCFELPCIRHAVLPAALTAAALMSQMAHAQNAPSTTANEPQTSAATPPRYAAADLKRAFNFMDGNHDGKVSREEASRFRGVAKNFDRADTNHDGFLSREEFGKAMNYVKPKQP